jgi:putative phosphoribosyl transferase
MIFRDRHHAGQILAKQLMRYAGRDDVIVLALPRGGVPVGFEVAQALRVPFDIFLVRKLGVPGHEELAMGAIASREKAELQRRERTYRGDRPEPRVAGQTVILVDDGMATGASMRAAATALRQQGPAWLVVAVPVAAPDTCDQFRAEADEVICAATPGCFAGVGKWYVDFGQTSDDEVRHLLHSRTLEEKNDDAGA